jgi:amino-acid N-acetyltransferase
MRYKITAATSDDVKGIVDLVNSYAFKSDGSGQTLPVNEAYVGSQVQNGRFQVAKDGNQIIGCVSVRDWGSQGSIGQAELRSLAVAAGYKSNGLGTALVNAAVKLASGMAYYQLHTFTQQSVVPLFESVGFVKTDFPQGKLLEDCLSCPKYQVSCNEIALVKRL